MRCNNSVGGNLISLIQWRKCQSCLRLQKHEAKSLNIPRVSEESLLPERPIINPFQKKNPPWIQQCVLFFLLDLYFKHAISDQSIDLMTNCLQRRENPPSGSRLRFGCPRSECFRLNASYLRLGSYRRSRYSVFQRLGTDYLEIEL